MPPPPAIRPGTTAVPPPPPAVYPAYLQPEEGDNPYLAQQQAEEKAQPWPRPVRVKPASMPVVGITTLRTKMRLAAASIPWTPGAEEEEAAPKKRPRLQAEEDKTAPATRQKGFVMTAAENAARLKAEAEEAALANEDWQDVDEAEEEEEAEVLIDRYLEEN